MPWTSCWSTRGGWRPRKTSHNRALAARAAVAAAGGAVGVLLSGVITDVLGWAWVFFLNVPIAALAITLSPVLLPESQEQRAARRLDVRRAPCQSHWGGSLLLVISRAWGVDPAAAPRAFGLARFPNIFLKIPGLGEFHRRAMPVRPDGFPFVQPIPDRPGRDLRRHGPRGVSLAPLTDG